MRLKRLELQGFKSFADKTEITFEDGITAVVGPNGSGKSNISDAFRWVLGEQSAKTLRGSKMGDVIFAGTQKRNSVGFCKVSLIFENDDHWLNIDQNEVVVSRKYYKSGESEYYINGNQCRLKDVLELFRDTGVGKEGYSIIGQGQVTNILSSNAADRRMIFEAATGILKYKSRKSDAQSRLLKTGENIDRLNDLLEEINASLEHLEKQSAQAKEYITCKDQLKKYELARFIHKTEQAEMKSEKLDKELSDIEKDLVTQEELREKLKNDKNKILEKIKIESQEGQKLKEAHIALREEILKSGSKNEITFEKIKAVNESANSLAAQESALKKEIEFLNEQIENDRIKLQQAAIELSDAEEQQKTKSEWHERIKAEMEKGQEKLDDLKQKRILFLNSISEVKINASKYTAMIDAIKNRLKDVDTQKETVDQKLNRLNGEKDKFSEKLNTLFEEKEKLEFNKRKLSEKENSLQQKKNSAIDSVHNDEIELGAIKSKLNLLKNMEKEYEGYNSAVKNLLKERERDSSIRSRILGTVADIIDVKKEYVVAIEVALGASLQNVVTQTEEDAKALINILKKNNMGRATFLPISGVRAAFLNKDELASMHSMDGVIGCGEELVDYNNKFKPVIKKLLGRTVVVKDIDTAIRLMRKNAFRFQTVTLEGEIIHAGGAMSGGSRKNKSTGILGRSDEIATLEQELKDIENRAKGYEQSLSDFDKAIEGLREGFLTNKQKLKSTYDKIDELQNEISIFDAQINSEMEKLIALNEEKEQLNDNISDIEGKLNLVSDTENKSDLAVDEKEIEELSKIVSGLREKNESAHEELSMLAAEISGLKKDVDSLNRDIERSDKEIKAKNEQISKNSETLKVLNEEINELNKDIDENSKTNKESSIMEEKLKRDIDEKDKTLYLLQTKLNENESSIDTCAETIKEDTDRKYRIDIELNKLTVEMEMLDNDMFERYDMSYKDVMSLELGINPGVYKREIENLKEQIKTIGNVNLNAIDEYAYTRSRHEQITSQLEDLMDSKRDLEELIEVLQRDMATQFKEQFKLINMNFERIFKSLFGGGKAELVLGKNESVLESDIEIVAQPPGKKLENISLLSGGEQALIAIAILFAMLELKPTPFCVLDEIGAALDESNVHRFASYLKNYSGKTQFLVITHKRGVMELSDAIYGVAMQEKGVSKVVSIKMPENTFKEENKRGVV